MWDNDKVFLWQLLSIRVRQSAGLSPKWPRDDKDLVLLRRRARCQHFGRDERPEDSKEKNQRTKSTNTHHEHSLAKHLLMALDVAIVY
jgi:hypothetical protein